MPWTSSPAVPWSWKALFQLGGVRTLLSGAFVQFGRTRCHCSRPAKRQDPSPPATPAVPIATQHHHRLEHLQELRGQLQAWRQANPGGSCRECKLEPRSVWLVVGPLTRERGKHKTTQPSLGCPKPLPPPLRPLDPTYSLVKECVRPWSWHGELSKPCIAESVAESVVEEWVPVSIGRPARRPPSPAS